MELWFTQHNLLGFTYASWCLWHSSGRGNISFQFFRLSAWDRYPCKAVILNIYCEKHSSSSPVKCSSKHLQFYNHHLEAQKCKVNADQWFHWPLSRPWDEVTVLHYLEYGNERPVVCMLLIELKLYSHLWRHCIISWDDINI